jgi:hypothetical protein
MTESNIRARYDTLIQERRPYLERAQTASALSLPFLVPEDGFNGSNSAKTPYQSFAAHAVRTLSSKILLALLPPNTPFFKFIMNKQKLREEGLSPEQVGPEFERALISLEGAIMDEVELSKTRLALESAIQHLVVSGNSLLFVPENGAIRWYRLNNYAISRDPGGLPVEIITHDRVHITALPEEVQKLVRDSLDSNGENNKKEEVDLFTRVERLPNKKWKIHQEANGINVPGSEAEVAEDKTPFIPLRFSSLAGEDYGRGLVEEYFGTVQTIESLSRLLNEGAIAMATTKIVVDKSSSIRPSVLAKTGNLGIISGNVQGGIAQDVGIIELQKQRDYAFVGQYLAELKKELSEAFLMFQTRDAERVTAAEVQRVAQELEVVLGGVYSILAHEFQMPLLKALMQRMVKQRRMPQAVTQLPKDLVNPVIITGLTALGRNSDFNKLIQLQQVLTPQEMIYVDSAEMVKRKISYLGIPDEGLVKDTQAVDAQIQQQQEQQEMMEVAKRAAPEVVKGLTQQPQNQ